MENFISFVPITLISRRFLAIFLKKRYGHTYQTICVKKKVQKRYGHTYQTIGVKEECPFFAFMYVYDANVLQSWTRFRSF